jgi:hypothetical protein
MEALNSGVRKMKRSIPWILVVVLLVVIAVLGVTVDRYGRHNAFHRSQAFKYKRWAELVRIYPVGTPLEAVVTDLALPAEMVRKSMRMQVLDVMLPLEIPPEDYRDYRGFTFIFRNKSLVEIDAIGPDGTGHSVPLSDALRRKIIK